MLTEKVPLVLLAVASCVATMMAQTKAMITLEEFPFPYRAANALISYVAYLVQSAWPTELAVLYPLPKRGSVVVDRRRMCDPIAKYYSHRRALEAQSSRISWLVGYGIWGCWCR